MKRLVLTATILGLTLMAQGCAVYAPPYGYTAPYYPYGLNYGFSFGYRPYGYYGYYGYRPYRYHGYRPYRYYWHGPRYFGRGGGYGWHGYR